MIVNLRFNHNYPLVVADALCHKDVFVAVKKKFTEMFEAGHSPASALEMPKYDLQVENEDDFMFTSAVRALFPEMQWCYRFKKNTGSV